MKQKYIKPETTVYRIDNVALCAGSSESLPIDSDDKVTDKGEILSKPSGFSLWDDDE